MAISTKKQPPQKLPILEINLLVPKSGKIKITTRLLSWILSSGRYIVILVEIVVVVCVILRYKLDADLADLQTKIDYQANYIQSFKSDEALIKQIQYRLTSIRQIRSENPDYTNILLKLSAITPVKITLTSVNFSRPIGSPQTNLLIIGQTPSNLELSAYIKALQQETNTFSDISLTNISFENQTVFSITGKLVGGGGKSS